MKNNWLNLTKLLEKILISTEIVYHFKKKYLMNLLMKDLLHLGIQKKINPDYLIYKYKTKRISPEDFENFQNPIDLFKDLRDGNINPKNDQINFKSDLGKITGNKK